MLCVRFPLSLRNVEDFLHKRGIEISYETVRFWWNRFGPMFAAEIRRNRVSRIRGYSNWQWPLDEVFVKINGETHYLWRAVNHEGEVLETYVTKRRDHKAALKFLRKSMSRHGQPQRASGSRRSRASASSPPRPLPPASPIRASSSTAGNSQPTLASFPDKLIRRQGSSRPYIEDGQRLPAPTARGRRHLRHTTGGNQRYPNRGLGQIASRAQTDTLRHRGHRQQDGPNRVGAAREGGRLQGHPGLLNELRICGARYRRAEIARAQVSDDDQTEPL
jgi:hypothetical protein